MQSPIQAVKERPILFSAAMVRAILEGRKSQTRRIVKIPPKCPVREMRDPECMPNGTLLFHGPTWGGTPADVAMACPYGQPGDRLWVRETFTLQTCVDGEKPPFNDGRPIQNRPDNDFDGYLPLWTQPHYQATDPAPDLCCERENCRQCRDHDMGPHWKPSIHMPRWASRILLEIVSVRVERLQDISDEDAKAEGVSADNIDITSMNDAEPRFMEGHVAPFLELWESINGPESLKANPFVWCVEFKRVRPA